MQNYLYMWQFWVVLIIIILVLIWFFGRNKKEEPFIGLKPLYQNYPKTKKEEVQLEKEIGIKSSISLPSRQVFASRDATTTLESVSAPRTKRTLAEIDETPQLPEGITPDKWKDSGKESKGEKECRRVLQEIYGVPFNKIRPKWLRNPKTNYPMELDGYNEELKIGFEYNGEQHYKYPHRFHKNMQEFVDLVERDNVKLDICDREGVYVITVPYNVKLEEIASYIRYYLPDVVAAREGAKKAMKK